VQAFLHAGDTVEKKLAAGAIKLGLLPRSSRASLFTIDGGCRYAVVAPTFTP
jgi:hypothetical protein